MDLLERIKYLCKTRSLTVSKLEDELNFPSNTIYQWKKRRPGTDKLESVAEFFNVSLDYLLGRTDIPDLVDNHTENELTMFFRINTEDLTNEDKEDLEQDLKDFMEMRAKRLRERKKK